MQDLNDKVITNTLEATEWNQPPSEIQNVIEALNIALSGADLNQLGKGIAGYVANGNFYTDSGAADAYVLTKIGTKQTLPEYTDGMQVQFIPDNTNVSDSTINVAGLGNKNIVNTSSAGTITAGQRLNLVYRIGSGDFEITGAVPAGSIGSSEINTSQINPLVQTVNVQDGAVATGTTLIPDDNTIPQNIEGDEYMTLAITPKNALNILEITVIAIIEPVITNTIAAALFQDSVADALASTFLVLLTGNPGILTFKYRMLAGTTSLTTFKVRAGGSGAGTTTFNGRSGAARHGGVLASSITIKEILQ